MLGGPACGYWRGMVRGTSRQAAARAEPLGVETAVAGRTVHVAAVGELDLCSASVLDDAVRRLLGQHRPSRLVLDLRRLTLVDSSGLRLLAVLAAEARAADWRLIVVRGPAAAQRTIEVVGLNEQLEMVDDPAEVVDGQPPAGDAECMR
jgi:anti-sigma B factor antagonist